MIIDVAHLLRGNMNLKEENEKLKRQVNAMRTLLDAANEELNKRKWLPIESAPKNGRTILLGYFNQLGKWRTLRGHWVSKDEIMEYWENAEDFESDWVGWYETIVEKDDLPNMWATNPTHWMPLPDAPKK